MAEDEIHIFLRRFQLSQYEPELRESGLENIKIIHELQDGDINDLINDTNMKENDVEQFKRAINSVKNGTYNSNQKQQQFKFEYKNIKCSNQLSANNKRENNKTIIFIGESGVGKTTLINSLCNYLFNVKYNDKFRYKLIDENENKNNETQSQTQKITPYYLNSKDLSKINYSLTIIDTPGFGNTESIKNDIKIKHKFKQCFEKHKFIDAIYFVVKATETRLSDAQKYIFNIIFNFFYKNDDIKENIFILFSFSDGSDPPAIQSINKTQIKYKNYFKINNSGFTTPNTQNNNTHKMFFNLGMTQFDIIFKELSNTTRKSTKQIVENFNNCINYQKENLQQDTHTESKIIEVNNETKNNNKSKKGWFGMFPTAMRGAYVKFILRVEESEHDQQVMDAFDKLNVYKFQSNLLSNASIQWTNLISLMDETFPNVIVAFNQNSNITDHELSENMKCISQELRSLQLKTKNKYSNIREKFQLLRMVNNELENADDMKDKYEKKKYELDKCNTTLKTIEIAVKDLQMKTATLPIRINKTNNKIKQQLNKIKTLQSKTYVLNQSDAYNAKQQELDDENESLKSLYFNLDNEKQEFENKKKQLGNKLDEQEKKANESKTKNKKFDKSRQQLLDSVADVRKNLTKFVQKFGAFMKESHV